MQFHNHNGSLIKKLSPKEYAVIQCYNQAGIIITNPKVKVYFTLPEISVTKIMMWNFHVNKYAKGRYAMILGRYLLIYLVLNFK